MEQPATPNPAAGATEKNHKKLIKSGSSAEGETALLGAEEASDGGAEATNSNQAAVNNEVWSPILQGDPSGWLKPPVDSVPTVLAAGGLLL